MRLFVVLLGIAFAQPVAAAGGAWVAFFRDGNTSVAFERSSAANGQVTLLQVSPQKVADGLVYAWDIKTEVHQFDCRKGGYRILARKILDEKGKITADETHIVTAMNAAFKDRTHAANTDALRKAQALACNQTEPSPAKPFGSLGEALAWMAN